MGVEQTLVAVPSCEACGTGCLHGYGTVRGESNAARLGWREAMEGAFAEPPLAVLVGAAFGSLLLDRIGADGFHVHIHGAPRTARSLSVRSAVAVAGNPDLVLRDIAPEAAGHRLAATAPMPVGFRRAEPALLAEIGSGGLGGVVLTTGDRPVPGALNLPAPLVSVRTRLTMIHLIASGYYGWPYSWLKTDPVVEEVATWYSVAQRMMRARPAIGEDLIDPLCVAATGFGALGRILGRGLAFYAGIAAALRVAEPVISIGGASSAAASLRLV